VYATFHFTFTGREERQATGVIRNQALEIYEGHVGSARFSLTADADTWLRFLAKETSLISAWLRRKIRFRGSPRLLLHSRVVSPRDQLSERFFVGSSAFRRGGLPPAPCCSGW
jgi:hypothetical protein